MMDLQMVLVQRQVFNQKQQQSLGILQMGAAALESYIEDAALENPLLEVEPIPQPVYSIPCRKKDGAALFSDGQSGLACGESLRDTLMEQLREDPQDERRWIVHFLIDNLDEKGYLTVSAEEVSRMLRRPLQSVEIAIRRLQAMEPSGVGARNLAECLCIQLSQSGLSDTLAYRIAAEGQLELLAKNQISRLCALFNTEQAAVLRAREQLLTLNPKPGNGFDISEGISYIQPDIYVVKEGACFLACLNHAAEPVLKINTSYQSMLADCEAAQVDKFLNSKLKQAQWLVQCLNRRRATLLSCANTIIRRQQAFFSEGRLCMLPLSMGEVAEDLGIHVSTVSRAVNDKYLQCQWGVFALSDFFPKAMGDCCEAGLKQNIQRRLKEIIDAEDKCKPLSDMRIMDILCGCGVSISRRTVAKYREEMGIPAAPGRKEFVF